MFGLRGTLSGVAIIKAVLKTLRPILVLLILFVTSLAFAETGAHTLLILPFENTSKAPGLEWISEAFPEILGEGLSDYDIYVVPREDRTYAFDRMGVPVTTHLSRQTLYRISEQMDADYVVLGSYDYDGQTFQASAQLLDMKKLYLAPEVKESGALTDMVNIQRALTWDLLKSLNDSAPKKESFLEDAPPIRLDAFENYIRGILSPERQERIQRFRQAVRLNPNYSRAMLELGKTYFANKEYESAASWFARVGKADPVVTEASFFLGISAYYTGDYDKAENAFRFLESRFPLTEVNNNLGVVLGSRGKREELDYLLKAAKTDENDEDYRFNLAVAYARIFDNPNAVRQLKEALRLKPSDTEAKQLYEALSPTTGSALMNSFRQPSSGQKLPAQRIKRNYDETSFRSLALEIERASEARLANATPQDHAAFHVERGRQFFSQGFNIDAAKAFQEAIVLDPTNAEAHAGMARVNFENGRSEQAVNEADAALRLKPVADAFLVLAQQNLKDNNVSAAGEQVKRALELEPRNQEALALKHTIEEKLADARN